MFTKREAIGRIYIGSCLKTCADVGAGSAFEFGLRYLVYGPVIPKLGGRTSRIEFCYCGRRGWDPLRIVLG